MSKTEKEQAKDFTLLFHEMKADLVSYVNNRVAHCRLDALEWLSKTSSMVTLGLIISFLGMSVFSFGLVALGFYLGEVLGSNAAGFGIVALFWLLLLLLVLIFRGSIKDFFLHRTVRLLYKIEKEEDSDEGE